MDPINIKVLQNRLGEFAVFYGANEDGKTIKLAYKRWFKTREMAEKWADKFRNKNI
jgi:hypothetical protein